MNIINKLITQPLKVRPKKLFLYDKIKKILSQIPHSKYCLDIGSGKGDLYPYINSAKYIGIEVDKHILEDAKKRFPDVDFRYLNFKLLNPQEFKFDLIVCVQVLGFNKNFDKSFSTDLKEFFSIIDKIQDKNGYVLLSLNDVVYKEYIKKRYLENYNEIYSISYSSINYRMPYMFAVVLKNIMKIFPNLLFFKLNHIKLLKKI